MREDTFTNTAADAGRYDFATFPGIDPPRQPLKRIPPMECGHEALYEDRKPTGHCARGRNCPNGGWAGWDDEGDI